jgi:YfiH family protein
MDALLQKYSGVRAFVSEKKDGSMCLSGLTGARGNAPDPKNASNRKQYLEKLGLWKKSIISGQLVHGNKVAFVDKNSPAYVLETDGLVTTDLQVVLTVTIADCYPVFFYDKKQRMIGLAHVGWQGAVQDVVSAVVRLMQEKGSHPEDIIVVTGPGICAQHYTIPEERVDLFNRYSGVLSQKGGAIHLDIKKIISQQLEINGVRIFIDESVCTYEHPDKYFSYRRDKPEVIEAQVAVITLA